MNYQQIIKKYIVKDKKAETFGNFISFEVKAEQVLEACKDLYISHKLPLKIITTLDERKESGFFKIIYVFGIPKENIFLAPYILVKDEFPSVTPIIHQASNYERKIKTFFGITPVGHPSLRSITLHENWPNDRYPLRKDFVWSERPNKGESEFRFRKMTGVGIYEIPVGPVHAGIIEPGHFRFSVAGEEILMLEPRLGYSHKGSEKLFEVLSLPDKIKLAERISGDSSFSHGLAFCQALESLTKTTLSKRAAHLRVIFCELERLANHFGDIGAIMADTGFNFGGANGGRLREVVMQINESLTGSRFLRNVVKVGGVNTDITEEKALALVESLEKLEKDFAEVVDIAEHTNSLLNRLKNTGILKEQLAKDHGVVGVAGRAVGFKIDARIDYPYAAYDQFRFDIAIEETGDVYARFKVRIKEAYISFDILKQALRNLPRNQEKDQNDLFFEKNAFAVGIVEGWRGDIVYLIATNDKGEISRVDVRDPSVLNWTVLGYAGEGNMVPDFPLINKSFNLSYSGNDL